MNDRPLYTVSLPAYMSILRIILWINAVMKCPWKLMLISPKDSILQYQNKAASQGHTEEKFQPEHVWQAVRHINTFLFSPYGWLKSVSMTNDYIWYAHSYSLTNHSGILS